MKVVRFDPHIQPGGQGEIVIALDPNSLDGKFERYFKVLSNDPQRPEIFIKVYGLAAPFRSPLAKYCNF
ncbi:MAG: hypothetical protein HY892_14465 [Deltaproteobacteria bacterium]|nr:hypothetical protein [Deltaproteobacteria bacterium]